MHENIVSDTSCFILLEKIDEFDLLQKLYTTVITTKEIAAEFGSILPEWIIIKQPVDTEYQLFLETLVDKGEASAIALAAEIKDCLLIVDDLEGRKLTQQLGLNITGTIGIIVDAKDAGIITSVKPILEKIKQTNFRIPSNLEAIILAKAGEI